MDIKQAAKELGISVRHLRRLIQSGQVPANKVRIKKIVEVEAWEIPDEVVAAANKAFNDMSDYENFGEWMIDTSKELGLTLQDLSKRAKVPIETLIEVARMPGYLSAEDQEVEERIGKVLMRAIIEKKQKEADNETFRH
jgi:excisionase family DNA binding protein